MSTGDLFNPGDIRIAIGMHHLVDSQVLTMDELQAAIDRHATGDFGNISDTMWDTNEQALQQGGTIHSIYTINGEVVHLITTYTDQEISTIIATQLDIE